MKLKITYATNKRKYISECVYQNIYKDIELHPCILYRRPCGRGAAANRYYYSADFFPPWDAEFTHNGLMRAIVDRKKNPRFDPKKYTWDGDMCDLVGDGKIIEK